jgi:hypothetical protein
MQENMSLERHIFSLAKRMKVGSRSGAGGKRDRKHNRAAAKEKRAVECSSQRRSGSSQRGVSKEFRNDLFVGA